MIFMNRIILLLFFLTSCSSLDMSYFSLFKEGFLGNSIDMNSDYIKNLRYSYIKVSYGNREAIFVLAFVNEDGSFTWIGPEREKIKTNQGTVIEVLGTEFDFKVNSYFQSNLNYNNQKIDHSYFIDLYNPDAFQVEVYEVKQEADKETIVIYKLIPAFNWAAEDKIYYSQGNVIKSITNISPLKKPLIIEYTFKY
jgi:hypothetical protein